jgi:hypothetical protein
MISKTPQNKLSTLFEMDNKAKKDTNPPKNVSTRQSTDSNDSIVDNQKFFTPTHVNSSKVYNVFPVQREIDFTKNANSKFSSNYYNTPKSLSFVNKIPSMIRYVDKKDKEVFDHKIILENILMLRDKRTTLMLRNIPNKYTLQNLVDEIINNNPSFAGKLDYINLPIDYEVKSFNFRGS